MKNILIILDGLMENALNAIEIKEILLKEYKDSYKLKMVDFNVKDKAIDSLNCIMNILGYSANKYDIGDRAYYEAIANNIKIKEDEVVLRCNIVNVLNEQLVDFTGGTIPNNIEEILNYIHIENVKIYHLNEYKNLLVMKKELVMNSLLCPPHFHIGENISNLVPNNEVIKLIIKESQRVFSLNGVEGKVLWPWGISKEVKLPSYTKIHNSRGGIVAGIDLLCGIAKVLEMEYRKPKKSTGYYNTSLKEKLKATIELAETCDDIIVHINGLDELAHKKDFTNKLRFLEKISNELIYPLLTIKEFKVAITCDHITDSRTGKHEKGEVFYIEHKN